MGILEVTRGDRGLQGVTGVTRGDRGFKEVTTGYRGLKRIIDTFFNHNVPRYFFLVYFAL